jgi:hypothetical protein
VAKQPKQVGAVPALHRLNGRASSMKTIRQDTSLGAAGLEFLPGFECCTFFAHGQWTPSSERHSRDPRGLIPSIDQCPARRSDSPVRPPPTSNPMQTMVDSSDQASKWPPSRVVLPPAGELRERSWLGSLRASGPGRRSLHSPNRMLAGEVYRHGLSVDMHAAHVGRAGWFTPMSLAKGVIQRRSRVVGLRYWGTGRRT